jgi:hypothetical protein
MTGIRGVGAGCTVVLAIMLLVVAKGTAADAATVPRRSTMGLPGSIPLPLPINPLDPGATVGGLAAGAAQQSATTVLDAVSRWVADGTSSLLGSLAKELDHQTSPDLEAGWFDGHYAEMVAIAILLALPLLFASAITAIARQDAGPLLRAALLQLPVAAIGTTVAIDVINLALAATDRLCAMMTASTAGDTDALFTGLSKTLISGFGGPGFATVLVCILLVVGGFFLTLEMVVRSAAVYVAVLFLPLALTGLLWPATARWGRRLAETLAVLILSKFVVVAIISMAVAAVSAGTRDGLSGLLSGAALLLIAGAAPFTLLRMVPIIEAGMVGHLEGAGRRAVSPPRIVQQQVEYGTVRRLLEDRGGMSSPAEAADTAGSGLTGTQQPERGIDPDGTQAGAGKPVPVGATHAGPAAGNGAGAGPVGASASGAGPVGASASGAGAVGAAAVAGPAAAVAATKAVAHRVEGAAAPDLAGDRHDD